MNKSSPTSTKPNDMGHKILFTTVAFFFLFMLLGLVYVYVDASNVDAPDIEINRPNKMDNQANIIKGDFDNLRFDFDKNKFQVQKSMLNGMEFFTVYTDSKNPYETDGKGIILEINDVTTNSGYKENIKYEDLIPVVGMKDESPLRDVMVLGKNYSFNREIFGEGGPSDDQGCYSGGGYERDYFLTDNGLAITIVNGHDIKGCEDKESVKNIYFDDMQIEEALKIIESIRYEK